MTNQSFIICPGDRRPSRKWHRVWLSAGCRGVVGPFPRPLWMNATTLRGRGRCRPRWVRMVSPLSSTRTAASPSRLRTVEGHAAAGDPAVPLTRAHRFRRLANLLNLSTPLGLLVARAGRAKRRPGPYGLVLAEGYRFGFPVASAFTVGDVVVTTQTFEGLARAVRDLLVHEERHSRQYALCLGLPYLALYTAAMGWSVVRTGDRASANVFERDAGLVAGGYLEQPVRPLAVSVRAAVARLRGRRDGLA